MASKLIPLPPDTDFSKPDAVATVNDRLRRLADSIEPAAAAAAKASVATTELSGSPGRPVIGTATAPKLLALGDTVDLTGAIVRAPNGTPGISGNLPVRVGTVFVVSGGIITGYVF